MKYRGLYDILGIQLMLFENIHRLVQLHLHHRGVISVRLVSLAGFNRQGALWQNTS